MHKIAFVFSGQGAQYSGMGKELYQSSNTAKQLFDIAEQLRAGTLRQCFYGTKEELSLTINTQPCLFCTDLSAALALKENGISPDYVAGFSLGEIAALAFAECLSHEDAFKLVCKRAEFMDEATKQHNGVMIAVLGLPVAKIQKICTQFDGAFAVNLNCPTQTAVACSAEILEQVTSELLANGAKVIKLAVSGAFHSPYMNNAALNMQNYVKLLNFTEAKIPVFSNFTALPYTDKDLIAAQINSPVLWQSTIENMIALGVDTFIEVGAGKTLCNLIKKISPKVTVYNVENKISLEKVLEEFSKC